MAVGCFVIRNLSDFTHHLTVVLNSHFILFGFISYVGRYPGHDGGYVTDPYGATTPGGGHPAYGEHSPFQTVPNLGGGGGPNDPWVPPGDLGGHHNGMQAQVIINFCCLIQTNRVLIVKSFDFSFFF